MSRRDRGARSGEAVASRSAAARLAARVLACAIALVAWARPAPAAPELQPAAQVGRITVLAEPGLERVARRLAANAEATLDRIAADLHELPTPRAIEVRLVRDASDLAAVAPAGRGAPSWAIGVAYPDLGVIGIAMRRGATGADPQATLRHELAHIALGAALGPRAPRWLHEGFAYQHGAEWSWERTETLAGMAWFRSVIPLEDLERSFPQDELPAHRAYAESYDFVGYLSRRGRWQDTGDDGDRWPFRQFLREVGQGVDLDTAAQHAFGKPLRELFEEWKANLGNRYMLAPIGLFGLLLWVVCAGLLVLAWRRRRKQNRQRLAQWDIDERMRSQAEPSSQVVAPPYVPWPGKDPLATDPEDDERKPDEPRWIN